MKPRVADMKFFVACLLPVLSFALIESTAAQSKEDLPYTVQQTKTRSGATITVYETKGNLAVTHDLDCIPLDTTKNIYTPADLYKAFAKCIQEGDYDKANDLFLLAGAYVRFDAMRVADKTAHQARTVLIMNNTSEMTAQQKRDWNAHMDKLTPGSERLAEICSKIKKIGVPDYYPAYMIQHGIQAFSKEKIEPLVPNFDPQSAWQSILDKSLHCGV